MSNQIMIAASKKFIATTAYTSVSTIRLAPSLLRQRPVSSLFSAVNTNNNLLSPPSPSFSSNTPYAITRRTVHVEQHRSNKDAQENETPDAAPNTTTIATATSKPSPPKKRNRSRRSRSKRVSLDERKVPSYKEFVHRFTVLSLYRGFLKCIRESMPHNQDDLRDQVRKEFQLNKDDTDSFTIKQNISSGQRQFEELKEFTGQSNKYTGESWIKTKDPDDPRGRVGTGWPWAK